MTRGRENPACSITETGKRADSVRMLHSHHSQIDRLGSWNRARPPSDDMSVAQAEPAACPETIS
jgi:hypothetical protein